MTTGSEASAAPAACYSCIANDIARLGLTDGQVVAAATVSNDGIRRELKGLRVVTYDIPEGCVATYYPEANVLIPLWHHAERSKVPAAKSVPVRIYSVS